MSPSDPNKFYDIVPPEEESGEPTIGDAVDNSSDLLEPQDGQDSPSLDDNTRRYGSDQLKQLGKDKASSAIKGSGNKGAQEAAGAAAKKGAKEAAGSAAKTAGKEVAKQGAKQTGRVAAEAAAGAETAGVGFAIAAADLAWQNRKLIIKLFAFGVIVFVGMIILLLTGLNVRFAEPDNACASEAGVSNNKVYIVGDSLSVGLKQADIKGKLENKQWDLLKINAVSGINMQGSLTQQVNRDKDIISQAGSIVVELGTNADTNYQDSLKELYNYLKTQSPDAIIYWVNYTGFSPLSQSERNRLSQQNQKLETFAENKGFSVIDWSNKAKATDYAGNEGLHPNGTGYTNLANYIITSIGDASGGGRGTGGQTIICLDPGHDSAPNATGAVDEYKMTVDLAKVIKKELEGKDYKVIMTRSDYTSMTLPDGKPLESTRCDDPEKIQNRTKYCSAAGASYMLSLHFDSSEAPKGPWTIIPPKASSTCNPKITDEYSDKNKNIGTKIQNKLVAALRDTPFTKNRGVSFEGEGNAGNIGCNASTGCAQLYATIGALKLNPPLDKSLIEFLPDSGEARSWFSLSSNKKLLAKAVADGIESAIPKNLGSAGSGCDATGSGDIVAIAKQELDAGVKEEPLGSNKGSKVDKYLRYGGCATPNPWCAAFVSWVYKQAGYNVPKTCGVPVLDGGYNNKFNTYNIGGSTDPQPGDILIEHGDQHTGIVEEYKKSSKVIISIEGNSGDKVSENSYPEDHWWKFMRLK